MKCERCGKEIHTLEVDMFNADGSDEWCEVGFTEELGIVGLDVLPSWTGNELDEEEQVDTIRCPQCKQFPFKKRMLDTMAFINVILYPSKVEK